MAGKKGESLPAKTEWPDSAPLDDEELIFSISCGNSHLHWATHYGDPEDYNPQIFWRTPHLKEEDMENEDLLAILSRNLPDDPHDHIFGKSVDATAADAVSQSEKRAAPLISVYVVSTNQDQEALLAKIWRTVPSRFFVMRGEDFFRKEAGRYDTMGTDRLATLTGAVHLHGHPALVFDGGTATTYSATDSDGKILGGGIGPGIQSKFRSLTKDTAALPEITTEEVIARVNEAQEKGKPLPTFARNTQEAMMADAFQEFALKGRNVIEHWLGKSYSEEREASPTQKYNSGKRVICTGGDGDILMQLLQPHYGGVIEHMDTNGGAKSKNSALAPRYVVEASKHLIHYGIACVLAQQVSLRRSKDAFRKNPHGGHVGKRIAKHFEVESDDGDNIYRGKVMKVIETEGRDHEFRIQYDDGDSEDVTSSELFDMFKLFSLHGEKKSKKAATAKGKKRPAAKRSRSKAKIPDDETAVGIPFIAAKSLENKSNGAQPVEKTASANTGKRLKSSEDVEKAGDDVPHFPVKPTKNKQVAGAPKQPDAKKGKKAQTAVDEKAAGTRRGEQQTNMEKAKTAKTPMGKQQPDAKKVQTSGDEEEKKNGTGKAKKVNNKAVDTASVPLKSAKRKANGATPVKKKPAAKKARQGNTVVALVNSSNPHSFVRKRIAKDFDGETFYGTIMEYDDSENPAYWHVEYDDGDEEDYSKKDLIKALKYYEIHGKNDQNS